VREDPWHQANRKWNHQPTCGDDVSTEEQNHSPAALTDAALKAALAAAAGIPARPVEDISSGYEPVVAEGASPLAGFAEAARNLIDDRSFEWAQPPASTLTLVSNRDDEEMKALEERRQTAISALRNAIAKAEGEERDDLEQALERLESAKNPGEIQAALTVAQSTLSREAAGGGSKSAGGDDMVKLKGEILEFNKKAKEEFDKLPTTDKEKEKRQELEAKVEAAMKTGDPEKIIAAQLELLRFYREIGYKYDPDGPLVKKAIKMEAKIREKQAQADPNIEKEIKTTADQITNETGVLGKKLSEQTNGSGLVESETEQLGALDSPLTNKKSTGQQKGSDDLPPLL
jgi:hypothetical protein